MYSLGPRPVPQILSLVVRNLFFSMVWKKNTEWNLGTRLCIKFIHCLLSLYTLLLYVEMLPLCFWLLLLTLMIELAQHVSPFCVIMVILVILDLGWRAMEPAYNSTLAVS